MNNIKILKDAGNSILKGANYSINTYNEKVLNRFLSIMVEAYKNKKNIIVSGEGNSGSVGLFFVRRCMHLKYRISDLHDAGCPAIKNNDIVIFISGTGTTSAVVSQAKIANKLGAFVVLITSKVREIEVLKNKSIQKYSNLIIEVGGKTKEQTTQRIYEFGSRQLAGSVQKSSETPTGLLVLGTQFEINALVFLMSLCYTLMVLLGKTEESLRKRHKNIE